MTIRRHSLTDLSSTGNAAAMHRICTAIDRRRRDQANTLPAPEGWQAAKPGLFKRLRALFLLRMTGIRTPELGEAYRHETTPTHLDPL